MTPLDIDFTPWQEVASILGTLACIVAAVWLKVAHRRARDSRRDESSAEHVPLRSP